MDNEIVHILMHVLLQGLIYSFVVMGVYLSSRVIKFDDLTTEGGFGFGGAITALLTTLGFSSWLTLPIAMLGGALAGSVTALFSICLKLATSNLPLPESRSIFPATPLLSIGLLLTLVVIAYLGIRQLLRSELGLLFTAVGSSPQLVTSLGKSVDNYKIAGLAVANSLTALGGALFVQWSGFFSITGNIGTLVTGIAGLILAEMVKPKFGMSLVLGAILYQALFAITIELELQPVWNNLIKAVLIVVLTQLKPRQETTPR